MRTAVLVLILAIAALVLISGCVQGGPAGGSIKSVKLENLEIKGGDFIWGDVVTVVEAPIGAVVPIGCVATCDGEIDFKNGFSVSNCGNTSKEILRECSNLRYWKPGCGAFGVCCDTRELKDFTQKTSTTVCVEKNRSEVA